MPPRCRCRCRRRTPVGVKAKVVNGKRMSRRLRVLARDRTNRPLLFRDRISNCINLFWPEPNRTRDSRICSWLTKKVEMLLTYIYRSTTSRVSCRLRPMYTSDIGKWQHRTSEHAKHRRFGVGKSPIYFFKYSKQRATTLRSDPSPFAGKTTHAAECGRRCV